MEVMDTSMEKFNAMVKLKCLTIPEDVLGVIAVSVRTLSISLEYENIPYQLVLQNLYRYIYVYICM